MKVSRAFLVTGFLAVSTLGVLTVRAFYPRDPDLSRAQLPSLKEDVSALELAASLRECLPGGHYYGPPISCTSDSAGLFSQCVSRVALGSSQRVSGASVDPISSLLIIRNFLALCRCGAPPDACSQLPAVTGGLAIRLLHTQDIALISVGTRMLRDAGNTRAGQECASVPGNLELAVSREQAKCVRAVRLQRPSHRYGERQLIAGVNWYFAQLRQQRHQGDFVGKSSALPTGIRRLFTSYTRYQELVGFAFGVALARAEFSPEMYWLLRRGLEAVCSDKAR